MRVVNLLIPVLTAHSQNAFMTSLGQAALAEETAGQGDGEAILCWGEEGKGAGIDVWC